MVKPLFALGALFASLGAAHFQMNYPKSIGFNDDQEDQAPCGGFKPDFSKTLVDFHTGGEALAMRLSHPQSNWLFRATVDEKAESGWKQLFPIVMQSGLGDYCVPNVPAPADWAGKKGVVSVVSSAPDGLLYQCVAVNFVKGAGQTPPECKNASSVRGSFTDDTKLTALLGNAAGSSSSSTPTSSSGSASSSKGAASGLRPLSATSIGINGGVVALLAGAVFGGVMFI
ncbi:hypothetical protein HIM_04212 [Hirsutella minnesotensis 3608]|uniref:Copper acquisition factor BIM1-like domain-containing protein n=1 Tax=Hirsutella minnesotensis 3608 TaxID=1043627 RepID=A0A0F7ZVE7_9HYPO|nr:hypothetical protein HIM_04212 [Hirsutella minnesotensis 3608]